MTTAITPTPRSLSWRFGSFRAGGTNSSRRDEYVYARCENSVDKPENYSHAHTGGGTGGIGGCPERKRSLPRKAKSLSGPVKKQRAKPARAGGSKELRRAILRLDNSRNRHPAPNKA